MVLVGEIMILIPSRYEEFVDFLDDHEFLEEIDFFIDFDILIIEIPHEKHLEIASVFGG